MADLITPQQISEDDYRAIEEAVMETARGRWFLAEYARRNRVSDTEQVLEAVEGLKSHFNTQSSENTESPDTGVDTDVQQMRLDIVDMTHTIEQLKFEIAHMAPSGDDGDVMDAKIQLDAVVDETETATSDILAAAEEVQEIAWEIRDAGAPEEACEKLDALATSIYTACSFQDLTGQRLRKVVDITNVIEKRLKSMVTLWGDDDQSPGSGAGEQGDRQGLLNGPALPGTAQSQTEIDEVLYATPDDPASDEVDLAAPSEILPEDPEDLSDPQGTYPFDVEWAETEFSEETPPEEPVYFVEDDVSFAPEGSDTASGPPNELQFGFNEDGSPSGDTDDDDDPDESNLAFVIAEDDVGDIDLVDTSPRVERNTVLPSTEVPSLSNDAELIPLAKRQALFS